MTVVAHGKEHKLHKIIACSQSGFFNKAIRNFKVWHSVGAADFVLN